MIGFVNRLLRYKKNAPRKYQKYIKNSFNLGIKSVLYLKYFRING